VEKSELFQFSSARLGKEKKKWVERSTNENFESADFTQGTKSDVFIGQVWEVFNFTGCVVWKKGITLE
jgi:hypothetical protein